MNINQNIIVMQLKTPPITGNIEMYAWIIGVLLVFITALVTYFINEKKQLRFELKDERDFYKLQYGKNIEAINNTNTVLEQVSKNTEKTNDTFSKVPTIVEDNNQRLKEIQRHTK
jgi:tRNA(Leu) C34 or U34 (ribose-2'-O)-methylase TrmL